MQDVKNEKSISSENVIAEDNVLQKSESFLAVAIRFVALLSVAIMAPALNVQALTGTIVNATLFLAVVLLGVRGAILIGIIPSVISAVTGLLPAAILPMVPFIIFSNAILIFVFAALRKKTYWKGVVFASVLKFGFLSAVSSLVIKFFVPVKVASQISLMMSWPQLFTALSGGILAYYALKAVNK